MTACCMEQRGGVWLGARSAMILGLVHADHMPVQGGLARKARAALGHGTAEWFLSRVTAEMRDQTHTLRKSGAAASYGADVRSETRVDGLVRAQIAPLRKRLATNLARIRLFTCVDAHVHAEVTLMGEKRLAAGDQALISSHGMRKARIAELVLLPRPVNPRSRAGRGTLR